MSRFLRKYYSEVLLFIFYFVLVLVLTYPLILNLNSSIYGIRGDHFAQLWENWWRKEAFFNGGPLLFTDLVYAPSGFDFGHSALQPLPFALNFILTLLTNEVLALNILLLLSFPLSGLAVYLLVRRLFGVCKARPCGYWVCKAWPYHSLAAAFSGLIYAFSMYHFSHAWEHSNLIAIYWMPFYVLALVNFAEKRSIKSGLFAALAFAAVLLDSFYYGYFMFFFTIFFFLFQIRSWLNRRSLKLLFLFSVFCLLFSVPFLLPIIEGVFFGAAEGTPSQQIYERSYEQLVWNSARPWHYILPSPHHPLWGGYSKKILDWIATKPPYFLTKPYAGREHNIYLGITALILSGVAVVKSLALKTPSERGSGSRRWVWVFLFLGIVMMIFSAPPYATISLHKIYFPSHYLYNLFPMFRAYARAGVVVLLCVSVLAGFGLKFLLELFTFRAKREKQGSRAQRGVLIFFMFLCSLVLFEVLLPSFNVDLTPPEVYTWLAEQPGDFLIVEYPPRSDHSDLLYQRVHKKRLLNPSLDSAQEILHSSIDEEPLSRRVFRNVADFPNELKGLGVKYIIFHKDDPINPLPDDYLYRNGFQFVKEYSEEIVFEVVGQ